MQWKELLDKLFGDQHHIVGDEDFFAGSAKLDGQSITLIGTHNHAAIGVALALAQASKVLETIAAHPGRPLLLLVDTQGQRLRRRDELLGINRAMAHLGCCIDLARRRGHAVIGLVYDQALSGGFITSGLIADACYALPEAQIRVMGLPAMARVTKISAERLAELSQINPVFAPGVENYLAMGGVRAIWDGDLQAALRTALRSSPAGDQRATDGRQRGGRKLAASVIQQVMDAP